MIAIAPHHVPGAGLGPNVEASPVDGVVWAIEAVAAQDLDRLDDRVLSDDLVTLRRQIDRLEAEFSRRLFRFDKRRGYAAEGAVTAVSWVRATCRLGPSAAAQCVEVARKMDVLPQARRAFHDGEMGYQHAAVIARSVAELGVDAVRPVEATLVDAARKLDPGRLRLVTRHLRHCVDPDGALDAANADHGRRWFSLHQTYDGVFVLDGLLDAEGGALLRTALDALAKPARGDDRTSWQRRADALVELATRQLQSGSLCTTAGQRPHLTVTTSVAALGGQRGAEAGEVGWAGPVPAETVRRFACDAARTEVTIAADGQPLDVGRTTRTIPAAIRRALVARDRGCRFPGCDRPPEWTDGHHLHHWADGGLTRLDNLVLLCRRHHRMVHEGGWRLVRQSNGCLSALPP